MIPEPAHSIRYEVSTPEGTFYTPSLELAQRYIKCYRRNHPTGKVRAVEINETRIDMAVPAPGKPRKGRKAKVLA